MNERIKKIRKALNLTLEKFGERLGVTKVTISRLENGVNNVTEQMQKSIIREFNVNPDYLLYGEGDMFVTHTHDEEVAMYTQDILDDEDDDIAEMIKNFIIVYCKLDDNSKNVLRKIAKDLLELKDKKNKPI